MAKKQNPEKKSYPALKKASKKGLVSSRSKPKKPTAVASATSVRKKTMGKREMIELARRVVGEASIAVVSYLYRKKDISEFEISKQLKIEVNDARSILYKLFNHNLVTYIRKKDRVKGWYISYWTLNPKGFVELKAKLLRDRLRSMKERLAREESNPNGFFLCKNACIRVDFDQAVEYSFRCPECGEILNPQDNTKTIENLRERIKELEGSSSTS